MSSTPLKNILSEVSFNLDDNQSNSKEYYSAKLEKFGLEFSDISGAKTDNTFKIGLNESISIKHVKLRTI